MEVKLSAEELEVVIGDYLRARGMEVNSITFKMKQVEMGVQWDPIKKTIFEGINCEVELKELPKASYKPTNDSGKGEQQYER